VNFQLGVGRWFLCGEARYLPRQAGNAFCCLTVSLVSMLGNLVSYFPRESTARTGGNWLRCCAQKECTWEYRINSNRAWWNLARVCVSYLYNLSGTAHKGVDQLGGQPMNIPRG